MKDKNTNCLPPKKLNTLTWQASDCATKRASQRIYHPAHFYKAEQLLYSSAKDYTNYNGTSIRQSGHLPKRDEHKLHLRKTNSLKSEGLTLL